MTQIKQASSGKDTINAFNINDASTKISFSIKTNKSDVNIANIVGDTILQKVNITSDVPNFDFAAGPWSHDNSKLAIGRNECLHCGYWSLYQMNIDGSNKQQILPDRSGLGCWKKDNQSGYGIIWSQEITYYNFNVFYINTVNKTKTQITNYVLPNHTGGNVDLSSDDSFIIYPVFENNNWSLNKTVLSTNSSTKILDLSFINIDKRFGPQISLNNDNNRVLITDYNAIYLYDISQNKVTKIHNFTRSGYWARWLKTTIKKSA